MLPFALLALAPLTSASSSCDTHPPKPPPLNFHIDLAPTLSTSALVVTPDNPQFSYYTHQNLKSKSPQYSVVVVVATEADVSAAVTFANKHDIPFTAKVSGHGTWAGLGDIKGGMNIWLRNLSSVVVAEDRGHVVVGGGAMVDEVVGRLWEGGKQTATALGQCIGITGSGIGGGLGPLMGVYGLGLDQFVGFRVVLANGTVVSADVETNPDLFWALRGAGHNFGIITEVKLRIYDRKGSSDWSYRQLSFSGDKVEAVFDEINNKRRASPPPPLSEILYQLIDVLQAIIDLRLFSNAFSPSQLEAYAASFLALSPLKNTTTLALDYPGLIAEMGYATAPEGCTPPAGSFGSVFGAAVERHVPAAMRKMYNLFNEVIKTIPELWASYIFVEGYGTEAMRQVPERSTAWAHRVPHGMCWTDGSGINVVLAYKADQMNATLEGIVQKRGEEIRAAKLEGQDRQRSYVNYAVKQESLESMYGYEAWRLEKLRGLKKELDPKNRFGFFAPIF
ncbi:hypothetical protein B0T18DRAFT_333414 [Schizothecium vesticola]|uniref:FAD-binding PCMH-type domain-containing protein n=1 Tax=Schizothecium vesticola TaxID=314040 RepID=A0AA40EHD5_9PEZI|nr:hypothetical protein B0T18DRAFT_333414 [Schizothecium vesticola]